MDKGREKQKLNIAEAAAKRLSYKSRTSFELAKYLEEKGFDEKLIAETIKEFQEIGYLNDSRYSLEFFRYGTSKGWAKSRSARTLKTKGVPQDVIEEAYEEYCREYGDNQEETALGIAKKSLSPDMIDDRGRIQDKYKARIARKLFSYGYGAGMIYKVIDKAVRELLEEDEQGRASE